MKIAPTAIFGAKKADVAHATNIPGKKVSQGGYSAFVPSPLPPELQWTPWLIGALSDADRLVGRLAGEGGRLPNLHILLRPFVRKLAITSWHLSISGSFLRREMPAPDPSDTSALFVGVL